MTPLLALSGLLLFNSTQVESQNKTKGQGGENNAKKRGIGAAPNQNAPAQGDAGAFAQIGDAGKQKTAVPPPDAPQDVKHLAPNFPAPANAIWVSPDAREGGAGTQTSPANLKNALQKAPEGATIVLRGGIYRDSGLIVPTKLTIQNAPGEVVWFDGSDIVSGFVADGNAWKRPNWTTFFPQTVKPVSIDPAYPLANNRDMVWIDGRYQTQVGTRAEVAPGKFFVDYAGKALYIGVDPAGKVVEATTRTNGMILRGRDAEKLAGTTVRGLGFRRFADMGADVQAPRVTLENCTFAWNGVFGLSIRAGGPQSPPPAGVILRGINASCNGQTGVRTWGAQNLTVENSLVAHNNVESYRRAWGGAGIKLMKFDGLTFRGNRIENNYSFGLWLDEDANDTVVTRNTFSGNHVAGMMFEICHRSLIAFNVMRDNNVGLMVSNATQGQIWNNTFADNRTGLVVKQGRRPNHQTPQEGDTFVTRDIVAKNNLFTGAKFGAKGLFVDTGKSAGTAPEMIAALDSNLYASSAPLGLVQWFEGGKLERYEDLSAFQAATGREKTGVQLKNDPFVNATPGNFALKPGAANQTPAPLPSDIAAKLNAPLPAAGFGAGAL